MLNSVKKQPRQFASRLLKWNREKNKRAMPWKGEKDPYRIWLSEIILQQTRVGQGLKYYEAFVESFPDIHTLAQAPDEKVFKLWEGLGYYSRCRNLLHTARFISQERDGIFPSDYLSIKNLKGVGPYTAAAIASFAYMLPYAVVDGNVSRVFSRIYGIGEPVNSARGKKIFESLASELLDKKDPATYNQALMDFGATICKPALPLCGECVFRDICLAYVEKKIPEFPVKEKKSKSRERWFHYLVFHLGNKIAIRQRTGKDIWQNLYEFPNMESGRPRSDEKILTELRMRKLVPANVKRIGFSEKFRQQLTHQTIDAQFLHIRLDKKPKELKALIWISLEEAEKIAFPKMIRQYLSRLQSGPPGTS